MAEFSVLAPREAGVTAVSALRLSLLAAMDKAVPGDTIILDLGKLGSADSSLAQLVIAFRLEAKLRNLEARVHGEDSRLSVASLLGCDVVCEACAFNNFRSRLNGNGGTGAPETITRPGSASGTKGARA